MNAKNLTIKNIADNGFRIGKSIRGKGTEIISADEQLIDQWGMNPSNYRYFKNMSNVMRYLFKEEDLSCLYIKRIRVGCGENATTYHCDRGATSPYTIQELYDTKFEGIQDVCIMKRHTEVHGYVSISKYTRDLESQKQLMVDLFALVGAHFKADEMDTDNFDLDIGDETKDISGCNSDYTLVHGKNEIVRITSNCEYVEGRPSHHNNLVSEDFWNDTYEECVKTYLMELDPKDEVTVYHRKGKDWYVGESLFEQDLYISYFDEEYCEVGEFEEETFYVLATSNETEELIQKFVGILNGYRENFSVESYINNELEIGGYDGQTDFCNDGIANKELVELIYEDIADLKEDIFNLIPSEDWTDANIKVAFVRAYNKAISKQINIKDDLTVEITPVSMRMATTKGDETSVTYKHLKLINKLGDRFGYTLVKTSVSVDINTVTWAIKIDEEEFHFDIVSVIANSISEEETLLDFISNAIAAINKRKVAKLSQDGLYKIASRIFVGINDSLESGNCSFGTEEFILKHHIDTKLIGGIRGDILLDMELSNFTKRVVMQAVMVHGSAA